MTHEEVLPNQDISRFKKETNLYFAILLHRSVKKVSKFQDLTFFWPIFRFALQARRRKSCENIDHDIIYLQLALQLFN